MAVKSVGSSAAIPNVGNILDDLEKRVDTSKMPGTSSFLVDSSSNKGCVSIPVASYDVIFPEPMLEMRFKACRDDSNSAISVLLHEARALITAELIDGFGVDSIQSKYEEIASKIFGLKNENNQLSLEELAGQINSLLNHNLWSLGNPKGIKGYSELCELYKKLNFLYEKELASIQDRSVPISETFEGSHNFSSLIASSPLSSAVAKMRLDSKSLKQKANGVEDAAMTIEIEAARALGIAIENAKNAYRDILQTTLDKVDKVVLDKINQLASWVQGLEEESPELIHEMEEKTQQFIDTLPLKDWQPKLTHVKPKYVVVSEVAKKAQVHFQGNFCYAEDKRYRPSLEFKGHVLQPINSEIHKLDFEIVVENAQPDKCTYEIGTLKVPYEAGWVFRNIKVSEYKVWLGALPEVPGIINVYYTAHKITQSVKHIVGGTIKAWGDSYYPTKWIVKEDITYPERGWFVIPSSVRGPFVEPVGHGKHSKVQIKLIDSNQIVTSVGLAAYDGQHMGRVEYHVEFDQVQDVAVVDSRTETIRLQWGNSVVLDTQQGEEVSKITFDSFDGKHAEFAGPDLSNPYLKIRYVNEKYQLSTEIPSDVVDRGVSAFLAPNM